MNNEIHNRFAFAAQEVLKMMLDVEANACADADGCDAYTKGSINVAIGITGDCSGEALFSFPSETALNMVKIMSGGMDIEEVDDFVKSAVGELSNIISGSAATALSEQALVFDILPPQISISTGNATEAANRAKEITSTLHTSAGDVGLIVRMA